MAQSSNWEADKMLDVYIHDYLLKRNLLNSAKAFMAEGKVATDPVAIDAPGGFLFEWWSVFWDIFIARTNDKHSEAAAAYLETQQMKTREQQQQQLHLQQLQLMQQRNAQMQRGGPNNSSLGGPVNGLMDNRMALLKPAGNQQGQLVQGNSGNMSAALQQIQTRPHMTADIKTEVNIGGSQKSMPMDPSSIYGQAILQSKSGLGSPGLNPGINSLPLKGWPLTGIEQLRMQTQKSTPLMQNQMHMSAQQQQVLSQAQAQNSLGSSPSYGDNDPRRFGGLPKGNLNAKEAQSSRNDVCSPMQSSSPQVKMGQMQQSSTQQPDQLQQQQVQQNNRKRKQHSSSGPANSTGTGNTVGPSPNSPPSTHTPGDGMGTGNSLQQANSMPKSLMMYEGTGGLASSSNQLDDIEPFGDVGLEDNVESFLLHDAGDGRDLYGTVKQSPAEPKEPSKGFTFAEVDCINTRSKVTSCHFSSDAKFLASAGHDKKAVLWNMDTLTTQSTPEEHKVVITDVRFRPNSTHLATASFDGSVRLWDASNPSYCLNVYPGRQTTPVMSLDFHPKKNDLFCFCDGNNEIQYWSTSPFSRLRVSKGGTAQVRFQPRVGKLLAAATDKVVSIFDVESDRPTRSFQAHSDVVNYICWDTNGELLASVSEDCVKVWSMSSGDCIHELSANGNQFHSCVFHPGFSNLLVVGGTRSLELWNMADNRSMTVPAHENIVSALAAAPATGMVASAAHDGSVKLWK